MSVRKTLSPARKAGEFAMGMREFITLVAAMMALNALSTDPMLPALPQIGLSLAVEDENSRQWIISSYMIGLGVGSLFYGSLSDRFGRRPVLLISLFFFLVATLVCALSSSLTMMLIGRASAGLFAAGSRVVAISVVRDRFVGDRMASIMSVVFLVFMLVPVIAPTFGQIVLYVANWRWIFGGLLLFSGATALWILLRLPETLAPENRIAINPSAIVRVWGAILRTRGSIGYMLATGLVMAGLVGFITSAQQIFFDVFDAPDIFPYIFAIIAGGMAIGSFANSRIVELTGARRMSQGALITLIVLSAVRCLLILEGWETMWTFVAAQTLTMLCFALVASNFGAISMEPFARGAGAASSFQAFLTTLTGGVVGTAIGLQFDGTTFPMTLGFLVCGIVALLLVLWSERGRLFTRPNRPKEPHPAR